MVLYFKVIAIFVFLGYIIHFMSHYSNVYNFQISDEKKKTLD